MELPPGESSPLTDASFPDPLFPSKVSETASHIIEPPMISIGGRVGKSKDRSTGATLDVMFGPMMDDARKLEHPPAPLLYIGDISA